MRKALPLVAGAVLVLGMAQAAAARGTRDASGGRLGGGNAVTPTVRRSAARPGTPVASTPGSLEPTAQGGATQADPLETDVRDIGLTRPTGLTLRGNAATADPGLQAILARKMAFLAHRALQVQPTALLPAVSVDEGGVSLPTSPADDRLRAKIASRANFHRNLQFDMQTRRPALPVSDAPASN